MKRVLAAAAVALSASVGYGQTVFGNNDCGGYVREHSQPYQVWVVAFLSGLNAGQGKPGFDPLGQVKSADQIILWVDNYCRKNPMSDLGDAAWALYLELAAKTGKTGVAKK